MEVYGIITRLQRESIYSVLSSCLFFFQTPQSRQHDEDGRGDDVFSDMDDDEL
jgi:hypothetical protein